jgi:hypothetical protein
VIPFLFLSQKTVFVPVSPVLTPLGFSTVWICLIFIVDSKKSMNKIKEKDMKKVTKFGLCVLIAFGFAVSTLPAAQEKGKQEGSEERQSSEIKQLTIRNSGFRSKSTVVIRYRADDKKIVEVIENGKKLPAEEFPRYESLIREAMEIPQIDRLLPEIERAKRRAESPRISVESKIREMLALRIRLKGLESETARRYQAMNELLLMEELNHLTEKISESSDLSQEEKIQQLKELLAKIQAMEFERVNEGRRRRLAEIETANVAKRLIEEIEKSDELSKEEKIEEIKKLYQRIEEMNLEREKDRKRDLLEIEIANVLRKMLHETAQRRDLSDREKEKEMESLLREAQSLKLGGVQRMVGIEKFKFDLHRLLEKEGLLPEGRAEFMLTANECSIDGKKLPKDIHERIMKLYEDSLGMKFKRDTKIILQLNEDRL